MCGWPCIIIHYFLHILHTDWDTHPVKWVFYPLAIEVNGQFFGHHYFVQSVPFIVQTMCGWMVRWLVKWSEKSSGLIWNTVTLFGGTVESHKNNLFRIVDMKVGPPEYKADVKITWPPPISDFTDEDFCFWQSKLQQVKHVILEISSCFLLQTKWIEK